MASTINSSFGKGGDELMLCQGSFGKSLSKLNSREQRREIERRNKADQKVRTIRTTKGFA